MRDTTFLPRARHVVGLQVRTKNADETNQETGRIGQLWQRFFQDDLAACIPNRIQAAPVMAVYTDYASDQDGEYSLTVGCEVTTLADIPDGMVGITIAPAKYAVFPVAGSEPIAIVEAWRRVWSEFNRESTETRAYTADFEEYQFGPGGPPAVTLYVAVS